jgi:hypothetical protein
MAEKRALTLRDDLRKLEKSAQMTGLQSDVTSFGEAQMIPPGAFDRSTSEVEVRPFA